MPNPTQNLKEKREEGSIDWILKKEEEFRDRLMNTEVTGTGVERMVKSMWIPAFISQSLSFSQMLMEIKNNKNK